MVPHSHMLSYTEVVALDFNRHIWQWYRSFHLLSPIIPHMSVNCDFFSWYDEEWVISTKILTLKYSYQSLEIIITINVKSLLPSNSGSSWIYNFHWKLLEWWNIQHQNIHENEWKTLKHWHSLEVFQLTMYQKTVNERFISHQQFLLWCKIILRWLSLSIYRPALCMTIGTASILAEVVTKETSRPIHIVAIFLWVADNRIMS